MGYVVENLEVASIVVSEIIQQDAHHLVGQAKRCIVKIRPKPVGGGFSGRFSNFGKCRSEVAGDVMSGVFVDPTGVNALVKFGYSRSNRARDIRLPHFVMNERRRRKPTDTMPTGLTPYCFWPKNG